jgi:peptide deformylase
MIIIEPHNIKSRTVNKSDIPRVKEDAQKMLDLLFDPKYEKQPERLKIGLALAHCQATNKDPLKFFVMRDGTVIVNPEIIDHTNTTVDSKEGCLSYPDKDDIIVQRWNKCIVSFDIIYKDIFIHMNEQSIKGITSKIYQHELQHMNGSNIYQ